MKKNLLLIAAILIIAVHSFATTFMIGVGGMSFTPATLTVHPGDVIVWTWTDGTHTTTSTSVPPGATSWNSNINSTTTTFSYTPTVLGTYQYQCNFHVSMGMVGTINVVIATGLAPVNAVPAFTVYPNPASTSLHILLNDMSVPATITVTNYLGIQVMSKVYNGTKETDISLRDVPNGTYFIKAVQGGKVYKKDLVVLH